MLKLVEDIVNGRKKLTELDNATLSQVIDASVANSDFRALEVLTNHYTGIYNYDDRQPYWLKSNFDDPTWVINFGGKDKVIKWDSIILDDDLNLTSLKHQKLLNAFKYWITAIDIPHENGGQLIKSGTAQRKCSNIIILINAILLHSKELNLARFHLQNTTKNFWLNVFVNFANKGNVVEGLYEATQQTKLLIEKNIKDIQQSEVDAFVKMFPYLKTTLSNEDKWLNLTQSDRQRACFWLYQEGYYYAKNQLDPQGYGQVLTDLLFEGRMLVEGTRFKLFPELSLREPLRASEFKAVENQDISEGMNIASIQSYLDSLRLIYTNLNRTDASQPAIFSSPLSVRIIQDEITLKKGGRTRTLPPCFAFNLMRQCYEFTKENQDLILKSTLDVLKEGAAKSVRPNSNHLRPRSREKEYIHEIHKDMPASERGYWLESEGVCCVDSSLLDKGIKQVSIIKNGAPNQFQRVRNNESLFDLYSVLQGAVQVLTGAIMARRQDEMISLKSHGNLIPNIDPHLEENKGKEYSLNFKVKKSGVGGKKSTNATINRPIPTSIAKFVWQLEQFNLKISKAGLNKEALSLFNNLNSSHCKLSKSNVGSFNTHLDTVCDYFETDLVRYDNGEYRRNYVRQHQLRRFFAMCFFWSKGFDGMDSLRWMLGHTDMEHLYRYISESESGAVLNGAKASVILRGVIDKKSELAKLENIDKVESAIAKRLGLAEHGSISLSTVSEAVEDYDDESYKTVPHISQIKAEQAIENEIIQLLEDDIVTLEPEFFTIKNEDGEDVRTFTLALKAKDLD